MDKKTIRELIYSRFIKPTENATEKSIGVEIEIPIYRFGRLPTDHETVQKVFSQFLESHDFSADKYDDNGVCYSATQESTGDNVSFDCSYNNLEFSFGKEKSLVRIEERFREYVSSFNEILRPSGHLLTGLGINPNFDINRADFIPSGRYRMLEAYLKKADTWDYPMYFHPYTAYGSYASASQVQIDVHRSELIETINSFNKLEPVKSFLFSNSVLALEPDYRCIRDILWENSTHGINSHNVGMYDYEFRDIDDLLEYILDASLFTVIRDGKTIHFRPLRLKEYFDSGTLEGEAFVDGSFKTVAFEPELRDIEFLRTYNYQDLTFRGTLEFRSCCSQPFSEAMTVAAFHLGLMENIHALSKLLKEEHGFYNRGHSVVELRKRSNQFGAVEEVDQKLLKRLIVDVLDLSREGLSKRGLNEEIFLDPLYKRGEKLITPADRYVELLDEGKTLDDIARLYSSFDEHIS